jgi:hypothetical protein
MFVSGSDGSTRNQELEDPVNVMAAARSIGLTRDGHGAVSGTIAEDVVLALISELTATDPGNDDLFADAAMQVRLARSAGMVRPDPVSVLGRSRTGASGQLRYRSEMADIFANLAIDIGLREATLLADTSA